MMVHGDVYVSLIMGLWMIRQIFMTPTCDPQHIFSLDMDYYLIILFGRQWVRERLIGVGGRTLFTMVGLLHDLD